jgi:hypothetical protein
MLDKKLDLLAFNLCLVDILFFFIMALRGLYVPFYWVVGCLFPSVAAYVVGCWVFKEKSKETVQRWRPLKNRKKGCS